MMRFAKWIFWLHVFAFAVFHLDSLVIGKTLGIATLGFYQMASNIVAPLTTHFSALARSVMLPAFAKIRERESRRQALRRTLAATSAVLVPIGCVLTLFSDLAVHILLGASWLSVSSLVSILIWAGVANALRGVTTPFCQALGHPQIPVHATLAHACLLTAFLYPAVILFGEIGVAWVVTATALVSFLYQFFRVAHLTQSHVVELLLVFKVGAFASIPFLAAGVLIVLVFHSPLAFSPTPIIILGGALAAYLTIIAVTLRAHIGTWLGPVTTGRP
jgi:O-antigen/teichoic acid export membrane protein